MGMAFPLPLPGYCDACTLSPLHIPVCSVLATTGPERQDQWPQSKFSKYEPKGIFPSVFFNINYIYL